MVGPLVLLVPVIFAGLTSTRCSSESDAGASTALDASASTPDSHTLAPSTMASSFDAPPHFDIAPSSPPPKTWYGKVSILGNSPCGPNSIITDIDADGSAVCTNYGDHHRLFHVGAAGITTIHKMDVFPDQVLRDTQGAWWISALSFSLDDLGRWGILKVAHGAGTWHVFPEIVGNGDELGFGQGLAVSGDTLFVTGISLFATTGQPPKNARVLTFNTMLSQYGPVATVAGENPCGAGTAVLQGMLRTLVVCAGEVGSATSPMQPSRAYVMGMSDGIESTTPLAVTGVAHSAELAIHKNWMALGSAGASAHIFILSTTPPHLPFLTLTLPDAAPNTLHTISAMAWHNVAPLLLAADTESGRIAIWNLENILEPQLAGDSVVDMDPSDTAVLTAAAWVQDRWVIAVGDTLIQVE